MKYIDAIDLLMESENLSDSEVEFLSALQDKFAEMDGWQVDDIPLSPRQKAKVNKIWKREYANLR